MSNEYPHVPFSGRARLGLMVLIAAAVVVAVLGIMGRLHHDKTLKKVADTRDVVSVKVIHPLPAPATQSLELPGNVMPWIEAVIYSQVNGYLKMWYTDIGAHVKKGQLMAIIDTPELDQQIERAQSDLVTAKARLELANITAARWMNLLSSDSVSRQEVDEKVQGAKAQQALVDAAVANVQSLKAEQAFNHLVAPFDGIVTVRNTDIGMLISNGSNANTVPLFRVADVRKLRVYVDVPQNFASAIQPGLVAQITFPDRPNEHFAATLLSTSEAIHATSRTLTVELEVDNPNNDLLPGAYTDVNFELPVRVNTLVVPSTTLLFRKGGLEVATVGPDHRVLLKSVVMGKDMGKSVEIRSGLQTSDLVIDSPSDSVANGDKVDVVERKEP